MKAISGATSSKLARRRRARALRSCAISLLLKEPFIEAFAQVLSVIGPEDAVSLQTCIDVGRRQVINDVLVDHFHRGAPRRAVGHVLETGERFGGGGECDELQGFIEFGRAL